MSLPLANAVAVITGAESGIGRAIAQRFSTEGASVAGTYLSDREAATKVQNSLAGPSVFLQCDVSRCEEVDAFFDSVIGDLGIPTVLVNCAGINGEGIPVYEMSLDRWQTVIAANLTGPFLFCRRFAQEAQKRQAKGKIINITSIHEDIAVAGMAEYCASKGGLRNLTRCLALELAPNIQVNNIAPGMILTPMNEEAVEHPKVRAERSEHIPLGRAGTADEVAELALFLASNCNYATGATFFLDGGLSLNLGQGA